MAIASMNPRYVFTRDRLPAVVIYSIATALAAVLGFLTYRLFDNFQWFVDVKHHAGGFALVVDLALFLAKLLVPKKKLLHSQLSRLSWDPSKKKRKIKQAD